MLRHERQVQDENAGIFTERRLGGKGAIGTPLANDAKQKGLGSSREAFGDVSKNISLLNPHALLKGQQTTARRALGDITNATPQRQHQVQARAAGRTEAVAEVKPVVSISCCNTNQQATPTAFILQCMPRQEHAWYLVLCRIAHASPLLAQ